MDPEKERAEKSDLASWTYQLSRSYRAGPLCCFCSVDAIFLPQDSLIPATQALEQIGIVKMASQAPFA